MICQIMKKNQTLFYGIAFVLSLCFGLFFCTNSSASALSWSVEKTINTSNIYYSTNCAVGHYYFNDSEFCLKDFRGSDGFPSTWEEFSQNYYLTFEIYNSFGDLITDFQHDVSHYSYVLLNVTQVVGLTGGGAGNSYNLLPYSDSKLSLTYINNFYLNTQSSYSDLWTSLNGGKIIYTFQSYADCPECEECQECETCPPSTGGGGDYTGVIRAIYICGASVVVCMFFYLILKMFMGVRR